MDNLVQVDIDSIGRFKYVMLKVLDPETNQTKLIVRGFQWAKYHQELCDNFQAILNGHKLNLPFSVLGGGRIYHEPNSKTIKIYGYSEAYGKADHELAASMIKEAYPNYNVTWTDEDAHTGLE